MRSGTHRSEDWNLVHQTLSANSAGVTVIWASPRFLGIPIPKTLVIWESPSHITLAIWVKVRARVTGNAHITRGLGMGMPKTCVCPYHCDTGTMFDVCERLVPPRAFAGGAIACVAVGIVPRVLSWRAEPPREISPDALLMSFECRPVMSPWLKPFDYPIRKSG